MPDFYYNKHLARGGTAEECAEMCNDRRGRCVAFEWAPPLEAGYYHHYDGTHQETLLKLICISLIDDRVRNKRSFSQRITAIKLSPLL